MYLGRQTQGAPCAYTFSLDFNPNFAPPRRRPRVVQFTAGALSQSGKQIFTLQSLRKRQNTTTLSYFSTLCLVKLLISR